MIVLAVAGIGLLIVFLVMCLTSSKDNFISEQNSLNERLAQTETIIRHTSDNARF